MEDQLSRQELKELAYVLQIPYDPTNFDESKILSQIATIRERVSLLNDKEEQIKWEAEVRANRLNSRLSTPCHEPVTIITNKDTSLMSNEQLVFMPDYLSDNKKIYYCLDKEEDVPFLLENRTNPFTGKVLTDEQKIFLEKALEDNPYPRIPVNSYFEELRERFQSDILVYTEPEYKKKAEELASMVENIGLKYEAEQVLNFATDLGPKQYNLFLLHKPINQKISEEAERNSAAAQTLNYIINYINIQKQKGVVEGNIAIAQIFYR